MDKWRVRIIEPVVLVTALGVGGCHSMWSLDGSATSVNNVEFMSLWKTYSHCQASSDPDEMRTDAEQLDRAVGMFTLKHEAPPVSPDFLQALVSEPPSRLAADPKAMVMACTLSAGQTAQSLGRLAVAAELFNSIINTKPEPEYAHYVLQASRGLRQLEENSRFVMDTNGQNSKVFSR